MYAVLYVLSIVVVNVGFAYVPLINGWPPMALAVGLVFVLRDFAQRDIGHRVLIAMAVGLVLSYVMASPQVAIASAVAFAVSEVLDWLAYTMLRRPLRDRVLVSSLVSTPVDSAVFLWMIGYLAPVPLLLMTASKLAGAFAVYAVMRRTKPART